MVIDTLNMAVQMPHQVRAFGKYSEEIGDYTELGLQERLAEPGAKVLLDIVDPYSYRRALTQPKLIVLGTNDRYWPVDAVELYFPDLVGEKYIHYAPNAGHGLGAGKLAAAQAIAAFYETVLERSERPQFSWDLTEKSDAEVMRVVAKTAPKRVDFFRARSDTRDLREAEWTSTSLKPADGGSYEATVSRATGFSAFFLRLTYPSALGYDYTLATHVEVVEPEKPNDTKSQSAREK